MRVRGVLPHPSALARADAAEFDPALLPTELDPERRAFLTERLLRLLAHALAAGDGVAVRAALEALEGLIK